MKVATAILVTVVGAECGIESSIDANFAEF